MEDSALQWLYDMAKKREWAEVELQNTLDVKASIVLTVVALVAGITSLVLPLAGLPEFLKLLQVVSVLSLSASAFLAVVALRPRDYEYEDTPEAYADWIQSLEEYYAPGHVTGATIKTADFREVNRRFIKNQQLNEQKSRYLFWSFWMLVPAVVTALLSLLFIAIRIAHAAA